MLVVVHEALNEQGDDAPEAARAAATALREALTNGPAAPGEARGAAAEEAMAALRAALARDDARALARAVAARLKREPPGKYELPVHEIVPGLYIGGWAALNNDARVLAKRRVTHILSVVSQPLGHASPPFVKEHKVVLCDGREGCDLRSHFDDIAAFIARARAGGHRCFVHCGAGISSAPTAVMAYLIAAQRLSYADARRLVVAGRPCARPNPGFVAQLQQYEAAVHGRAAANPG